MKEFEHCTESELAVFARVAEGERADHQDQVIVKRLLEMNLFDEDRGMITVPAMVWHQWQKYKEEK